MNELGDAGSKVLNVHVSENMVERLGAYSRAVASFPCAVKEVKLFPVGMRRSNDRTSSFVGGMDGSMACQNRLLQLGNRIRAPCIQNF